MVEGNLRGCGCAFVEEYSIVQGVAHVRHGERAGAGNVCAVRGRTAAGVVGPVAGLTFAHVQQREGRWVLVDIVGKRNKVRSVPLSSWAKFAIDQWAEAAGISEGRVFRSLRKGGHLDGESMTSQAIYDMVRLYADKCVFGLAAHDLRRTFAKLAHRGKAGLDQIQLSLGHVSIKTTERYLGVEQDLTDAPCDRLGLKIE